MEKQRKQRVNVYLRLPPELATEVKTMAGDRGVSANTMSIALLRYGLRAASGSAGLVDRLALMGVK